ncbi:alpha-glycosidase [Cohnella sp. JJ-181]|uniref:alpha-glycosidase n=1 Tax=Cohnella rhizoplanae TaxID=2974897 RepID=UPI0022FFC1D7|nr:alpha-glycosidase [Cohnella sp. JJ-181]CAI6029471.1 Neopullulanase [Cohnella sp. JJ-181]
MQLECFYHSPRSNWAYSYDRDTFHLRVRTKKNDVDQVVAVTGDKYDWERLHRDCPMEKIASDKLFDYWECEVKPERKRFSYGFRMASGDDRVWMIESGFFTEEPCPPGGYYEMPFIHEIDIFRPPEWTKSAVFYQIMPDRFMNGDPSNDPPGVLPWGETPTRESHFGGDLQGIIDRLDYLTELGVTAVYLTPVFEAPSNHKYDTVDYRKVDPHFGDTATLKRLVDAAHAKGLRIVLDAVFNHTSVDFPPFKDVVLKGEKSKFAKWYHIYDFPVRIEEGNPNYDTFGFFAQMPKLNTANPEVKNYLFGVAEYWLKEVGIDGWRLDVANEIDHAFWRDFRRTVKNVNPEAYIIGEVWSDSLRWLLGDQFDSVMNYPFADRVNGFFSPGEPDAGDFADKINSVLMRYPQQTNEVVFNMLSSHDTPRILTMMGGDKRRLKLAIVFLLTYIGTPCIFYGDEVGLVGEGDPDCRKCMEWDPDRQDRELFDFYRLLIDLRKSHQVLRSGRFRFLKAEAGDNAVVYERIDEREHFTIWMNNSENEAVLAHPMIAEDWIDALSGEPVRPEDGVMRIRLEPLGYRILSRTI